MKSLLWKVYKVDAEVCHYIFGTMHTGTEEAYTFSELAKKYISRVAAYAGEMDLSASSNMDIASHFNLPEGLTLEGVLQPKKFQKARKIILKSFGFDITHYNEKIPFYLSNLLSAKSLPNQKYQPLDYHLWQYAMAEGKQVVGVETVEDQIRVLLAIPLDYQVKTLLDSIRNISSLRKKTLTLNRLYADANAVLLYKLSKKQTGAIRNIMIYERNERMVEKILEYYKLNPTFVSIGAAHLPGAKGVLAGLKRAGYKLKMIKG